MLRVFYRCKMYFARPIMVCTCFVFLAIGMIGISIVVVAARIGFNNVQLKVPVVRTVSDMPV